VLRIAEQTARKLGLERELEADDVILDDRYHAGTYGIPDRATLDAMRMGASLEGMVTDPVYEGKSLAGMIDLVRRGEIGADSNVLYAHLGGQPALNAYAGLFS
jgi:1-aminocyclopropane-1-carboxylate deaminase